MSVLKNHRGIIAFFVFGLMLWWLFNLTDPQNVQVVNQDVLSYSEFVKAVDDKKISNVTINGHLLYGRTTDSHFFRTYAVDDPKLVDRLTEKGISFTAAPPEEPNLLGGLLSSLFPTLLIIGAWWFFVFRHQGGGRIMGFGKSRARLLTEKEGKVTFDDVAGIEEAKQELQELVEFLKDPQKFQSLGGKIPKGCLLVGPPGTGKTLTARAVAGEASVPFFTISGSDFVEMFVGVGASRVRDMFAEGRKHAPCIIFIDEIDAVGRHRGAGLGGGNDEREQTLNQMLVEMDGIDSGEGVIIIAATNRPDVLDPALLRPGRFDRQIVVPNPDVLGREKILKVHMKKVPLANDVEPSIIARGTPGFSGADLANLVNEAALLAARLNKKTVGMAEFEAAKDKVMMGAERRSMVMSDEEKKLTAYHEAGHALCTIHSKHSDPIHKATIVPRGRALGLVMRLPERDRLSVTRAKLLADLTVAMGGRMAEEIIFGEDMITTGASSDIQMATSLARQMVTEWGMSDKLGAIRYSENQEEVFLGHSVARSQNMSNETALLIDMEIHRLVGEALGRARTIISDNRGELEIIAQALLEHETLSGDDIKTLLRGEVIEKKEPEAALSAPGPWEETRLRGSVPTSGGTLKPISPFQDEGAPE
jgi:cell division protease FtsH